MKNIFCIIALFLSSAILFGQQDAHYSLYMFSGFNTSLNDEILDGTITAGDVAGGGSDSKQRTNENLAQLFAHNRAGSLFDESIRTSDFQQINSTRSFEQKINRFIQKFDWSKYSGGEEVKRMLMAKGEYLNRDGSGFEVHSPDTIYTIQGFKNIRHTYFESKTHILILTEGSAKAQNREPLELHMCRLVSMAK